MGTRTKTQPATPAKAAKVAKPIAPKKAADHPKIAAVRKLFKASAEANEKLVASLRSALDELGVKDNEGLKVFLLADATKKQLDGFLSATKKELDRVHEPGVGYLIGQGIDRVTIEGKTVFIHNSLYAGADGDANKPKLIEALKAGGMGVVDPITNEMHDLGDTAALVKEGVNAQQLSAMIRELPKDPKTFDPILPEQLKGILKVTRDQELRAVAGSK